MLQMYDGLIQIYVSFLSLYNSIFYYTRILFAMETMGSYVVKNY